MQRTRRLAEEGKGEEKRREDRRGEGPEHEGAEEIVLCAQVLNDNRTTIARATAEILLKFLKLEEYM